MVDKKRTRTEKISKAQIKRLLKDWLHRNKELERRGRLHQTLDDMGKVLNKKIGK